MANKVDKNRALLIDFLNWMHSNVWLQDQSKPAQVHVDAYLASLVSIPNENQALLIDFLNWMHLNAWPQDQAKSAQVHVDAYLASLE